MLDDSGVLKQFGGVARLFPLPNVVLFPQVVQPLHIFEPRYRQMTADALADDRLIAMVLLQAGWEADYEGEPPIHPVCCLGHIFAEQRLPDGRYNLLLRGLSRARIIEELPLAKPYRSARLEVLPEGPPPALLLAKSLRAQIVEAAPAWFPQKGPIIEQLQKLLGSDLPLGVLCDLLAFAIPLRIEAKQQLLEELDSGRRALALLKLLKSREPSSPSATDGGFPPDFSSN